MPDGSNYNDGAQIPKRNLENPYLFSVKPELNKNKHVYI